MRNLIVGTDWSSDCDDVMAMRIFCKAHKDDKVRILGVCLNDNTELAVASLDGFLKTERCKFPIGFDFAAEKYKRKLTYQTALSKLSELKNCDAEEGVAFYRRLLAESKEPVEIAEIGYEQVLSGLLNSPPDGISPLSGRELVAKKVAKLWLMAGKWDVRLGKEHNLDGTKAARKAGKNICKNWPTPITFLGWEVGSTVLCGSQLPASDTVGKALEDYGRPFGSGREGWDPMLALLACVGNEAKAGYATISGKAKVSGLTGRNSFRRGDGMHQYVVKVHPDAFYSEWIDKILARKD